MRIGAATLSFLKSQGDQDAAAALARGKSYLLPAHAVGMTPGFFYSQGAFQVVPVLPLAPIK